MSWIAYYSRHFLFLGGVKMCECKYMQLALENAKKGVGFVNPNPMVGAVIVKNGKIIGEGYHKKYEMCIRDSK